MRCNLAEMFLVACRKSQNLVNKVLLETSEVHGIYLSGFQLWSTDLMSTGADSKSSSEVTISGIAENRAIGCCDQYNTSCLLSTRPFKKQKVEFPCDPQTTTTRTAGVSDVQEIINLAPVLIRITWNPSTRENQDLFENMFAINVPLWQAVE